MDINKELIVGYKAVQNNVNELIHELKGMEEKYLKLSEEDRKIFTTALERSTINRRTILTI